MLLYTPEYTPYSLFCHCLQIIFDCDVINRRETKKKKKKKRKEKKRKEKNEKL